MSIEESLDVTRIYSVADQLPAGTPLIRHCPFRARTTRLAIPDW
jgi:magnesium chelatase family protein